MTPRKIRIPLDAAQDILIKFGIKNPTKEYERWKKDDGFDLDDFERVLSDSQFIIIIDSKAWLQEELEDISVITETTRC